MRLDYLLQEGTKGYVKVDTTEEYDRIKEYLRSHDYRWFSRNVEPVNSTLIIFIPYADAYLTYSDHINQYAPYIKYSNITQEVYQLAGLLPTPYEFW